MTNENLPVLSDTTICECGNNSDLDGFVTCDDIGQPMDPTELWAELGSCYCCQRCGKGYRAEVA